MGVEVRLEVVDLGEHELVVRSGSVAWGRLIKPVGYEPGRSYPFVIMLTWPDDAFICDGHYATAFPPQPLANNGFLVLITNSYEPIPGGRESAETHTVREAEGMKQSVESVIGLLSRQGLVDTNNVGIIGFSRSAWKVDYILTHSSFRFRAASSADSGIYNYGAYWMWDEWGPKREDDAAYGGPPYGATLQEWIKYAPAFNADQVQSPVLMEYTGGGVIDQPWNAYEFHVALRTLRKPVDLFFYPNGQHPLDTPFEREASLQRNVDWFRFWMHGYEGGPPDYDRDQYVRWRDLRKLEVESEKTKDQKTSP